MKADILKGILLVDDDPLVHFINRKVIQRLNLDLQIVELKSAQQALERLQSDDESELNRPCLILLDLSMPGLSGWDFLEEYKSLPESARQGISIMILSTSENPSDRSRADAIPEVEHYITKPLSKELLLGLIDDYWPETLKS